MKFKLKRIILLALGMLILLIRPVSKTLLGTGFRIYFVYALLVLIFLLFHKFAWKCPHCGKNPGYNITDRCPHCNEFLDP